jgi:HPt (histidine-containing phosphotransfer) domain-containing protein
MTTLPDVSHLPILDREVLAALQSLMGDDFAASVDIYLRDSAERMHCLAQSTDVAMDAHSLKSTSQYVGAMRLAELAKKLEALARNGAEYNLQPWLDALQQAFAEVKQALQNL